MEAKYLLVQLEDKKRLTSQGQTKGFRLQAIGWGLGLLQAVRNKSKYRMPESVMRGYGDYLKGKTRRPNRPKGPSHGMGTGFGRK